MEKGKSDLDKKDGDKWDYIIIGGGINGLLLGALLSKHNKRVLILEKNDYIGGRLKVENKDGFKLENGLHLLKFGWKSPLYDVLRYIRGQNEKKIFIHPIYHYYLFIGNETKSIKPSFYERRKSKWFNRGWITVPRNMNEMRHHHYFSAWNLMRIFTTGFKCNYEDIAGTDLAQFIVDKKLNDISARYLKLTAGALMNCPYSSVASAGEVIRHIKWSAKQPTLFGYPSGGWQVVLDRLVKEIKNKGLIKLNENVKRVLFETQNSAEQKDNVYKAIGVKTEHHEYYADTIISAVPPRSLQDLFVDENEHSILDEALINFLKNIVPTAGISFDIALSKKTYGSSSFLYTENPNGHGIFLSNLDPSTAPKNKQLFSAFVPISPIKLDDSDWINENIEKAKKQIYKLFPKMKQNILWENILVHKIVDSVQININQYKDKRPKSTFSNIENAYMIGDFLNCYGSGGEIGYNSVWKAFWKIKEKDKF